MYFQTKNSIVHYLLSRNLLDYKTLVDGDVTVSEITSRNRNYAVLLGSRPGLFVKHIRPDQLGASHTLSREAYCYRMVAAEPAFAPLAALMPQFHAYDGHRHVLVIELLPQSESVANYYRRTADFGGDIAVRLGSALGTYHSNLARETESPAWSKPAYQNLFPKAIPWILLFHGPEGEGFRQLSAANTQLRGILNRYAEFPVHLDQLHAEWSINTLIHGDMKFENCVLCRPNGANEPQLKVIDWEIADLGDGCWDVGAIFQSFLNLWVFSMPASFDTPPEELETHAKYPLNHMVPAIKAFWRAYADRLELEKEAEHTLLQRCVRHAAARMLQTVFESMNSQAQLSPNAVFLCQLSLNILLNTDEATSVLLGLG
ncbi:MAG: phosphotransferase [Acidobacteriia bacterium]|nr:phosphotransferase [Terriglobia bacterium]